MSNDTSYTAAGKGAFGDYAEATRRSVARSTLNGLMTWLGETGLAAARESAGLQAVIDQHAAAVRDALIEAQWQLPPTADIDWSSVEWPALRLIAICSLARAGGYV
ncbi:DUF6401 family natural product biosynthesis protein [Dactylosporangium sp. NPDC049140]|uniref:DUF6401 family natural product biosynthesis protein n=1 Tax=Dactylosporangium sp. NPDC049140 TaxID=3155647 RepID=UPI0033D58A50